MASKKKKRIVLEYISIWQSELKDKLDLVVSEPMFSQILKS